MYGYASTDQPVEMVNAWVSVEMDLSAVKLPEIDATRGTPQPIGTRKVVYAGHAIDTPVYDRDSLGAYATMLISPRKTFQSCGSSSRL